MCECGVVVGCWVGDVVVMCIYIECVVWYYWYCEVELFECWCDEIVVVFEFELVCFVDVECGWFEVGECCVLCEGGWVDE